MSPARDRLNQIQLRELTVAAQVGIDDLNVPSDAGALAHGSIVEGLGNSSSDIDVVVISRAHRPSPRGIQQSVVEFRGQSYRLEVVFSTEESVRQLAARVNACDFEDPESIRSIRSLLELYERFCFGHPVRFEPWVRSLQAEFDPEHISRLLKTWHTESANVLVYRANAMLGIGDTKAAARLIRELASSVAKAWAAGHGETYVKRKFLSLQLMRAGLDVTQLERVLNLCAVSDASSKLACHLDDCICLAAELGLDLSIDFGETKIEPAEDITTWLIGRQTHLLRSKKDLFALGYRSAQVWRKIEEGQLSDWTGAEARILRRLHRSELIQIRHPSRSYRSMRRTGAPAQISEVPLVTSMGARFEHDDDLGVRWIPMPVDRFVSAGVSMVYISTRIEARREDAVGAYGAEQWGPLTEALRAIVKGACECWLLAHGIYPLPADLIAAMERVRLIPESVVSKASALQSLRIRSEEDVELADVQVEDFLACLPGHILCRRLRNTTVSLRSMASALVIGRPWFELVRHLGLSLDIGIDGISISEMISTLEEEKASGATSRAGQLKFQAGIRQLGFERSVSLRKALRNRS